MNWSQSCCSNRHCLSHSNHYYHCSTSWTNVFCVLWTFFSSTSFPFFRLSPKNLCVVNCRHGSVRQFWCSMLHIRMGRRKICTLNKRTAATLMQLNLPGKCRSLSSINGFDDWLLFVRRNANEFCASSCNGIIFKQSWYAFFASSMLLSSS